MAEGEGGYNPIGYHLGTVWPHDNSIIASALARYGYRKQSARVAEGVLQAAVFFDGRLPDAFAGFAVRVPPLRYGGTERVIFELTEELVRRGHDITLFSDATSQTSGRLRAVAPRPLWQVEPHDRLAYQVAQVEEVVSSAEDFDLIHWHIDYLH